MTLKTYLQSGAKDGFALGAYNFFNLETLFGICEGCKKSNSPAILALSESGLKYFSPKLARPAVDAMKKKFNLPLFLHLDHGHSFEICKLAVDLGFDSVMIDGSALPFEDNVRLTQKVVDYAHKKVVLVEAELGVLSNVEDSTNSNLTSYTKPKQAQEFIKKTKCDSLAVAIGTSHGAYKFHEKQEIRFDILEEIENMIPKTPLVLHGASSVPEEYVKIINENGGKIDGAIGIPEQILREVATKHHIAKINTDTDIRLCISATFRKHLTQNPNGIDLRKPGAEAIEEISKFVADKNRLFGSENKI